MEAFCEQYLVFSEAIERIDVSSNDSREIVDQLGFSQKQIR